MGVGAKAKATNLKILEGTYRADRENKEAPKLDAKAPEMPEALTTRAKKYWPEVVELLDSMKVITIAEKNSLEVLVETYAEWKSLTLELKNKYKGAFVYETVTQSGDTMIRPLPQVAQRADAARRFQALLAEFGLTPSARNKVKAISKTKNSDPWDDL